MSSFEETVFTTFQNPTPWRLLSIPRMSTPIPDKGPALEHAKRCDAPLTNGLSVKWDEMAEITHNLPLSIMATYTPYLSFFQLI